MKNKKVNPQTWVKVIPGTGVLSNNNPKDMMAMHKAYKGMVANAKGLQIIENVKRED